MKKTIHINLKGKSFPIDEDAYEYLDAYLKLVENHFSENLDCQELVDDIEESISIKLSHRIKGDTPLNIIDVDEVIDQVGRVEHLNGYKKSTARENPEYEGEAYRTGKRLYRNGEDKKIAGVCSGIAEYVGVDPIVIRLAFAFAIFFGGLSFMAYILLIILIPEAKTREQKQMMKGKRVNMDDFMGGVEQELEDFNLDLEEFKRRVKQKRKQRMYR